MALYKSYNSVDAFLKKVDFLMSWHKSNSIKAKILLGYCTMDNTWMSFPNITQIYVIDLSIPITIYAFENYLVTLALPKELTLDLDHKVPTQCMHNKLQQKCKFDS